MTQCNLFISGLNSGHFRPHYLRGFSCVCMHDDSRTFDRECIASNISTWKFPYFFSRCFVADEEKASSSIDLKCGDFTISNKVEEHKMSEKISRKLEGEAAITMNLPIT